MRIQYCDGYYQDGDLFYYHSNETGLDTLVSEDEAIAHKPEILIGDEDREPRWHYAADEWNSAPWYSHNHEDKPGMYNGDEDRYYNNFNFEVEKEADHDYDDLWSMNNTYVEAINMLEEVCDYLEKYGNFDGVGAVYETILWMKEQKRDILKKIGIIY